MRSFDVCRGRGRGGGEGADISVYVQGGGSSRFASTALNPELLPLDEPSVVRTVLGIGTGAPDHKEPGGAPMG